jgi:hypothetical protein
VKAFLQLLRGDANRVQGFTDLKMSVVHIQRIKLDVGPFGGQDQLPDVVGT